MDPEVFDRGVRSNGKLWDMSRRRATLADSFCPELELSVPEDESTEEAGFPGGRVAILENLKRCKL